MSDDSDESEEDSDTDDGESDHLDWLRDIKLVLEVMKMAASLVEMLR
ncbi:hypothetical protein [Halorubrum sp. F4]|nr:hypothetical protein [Halorubrum sp. F4]